MGIDFGYCGSSAAVAIGGDPRPVKDSHRLGYTIPSVAYWDAVGSSLLVGEAAEFAARDDLAQVVREFKRDVGKGITYPLGDRKPPFSTADLIGALVRQFVAEAAAITKESSPPKAAVLTVPAHWEGHARNCVADAARGAGVEPYLLPEPVAAALYHEYRTSHPLPDGEPILVYHLGGGAFSAALLIKRNGRFDEPIPCRGTDEVGGAVFDSQIYRDLLAAAPSDSRQRLEDRGEEGMRFRLTLAEECRRLKHQLSRANRGTLRPDPQKTDWVYALDRARFESLIRPQLDATIRLCRELTTGAGIAAGAPVRVLLTGGATRIPLVRQVVESSFGGKMECALDPELAVCQGAALHAARICPDPTLGDPDLAAAVRAVEAEQKKQMEEAKKKPFVFLLAGRTGVGKSSTINSLLGKDVAPVGDYAPTTAEVTSYPVQMGPVGFNVVDTPGLCDGKLKRGDREEMKYLEMMSKAAPTIHSLWFVSTLHEPRLRDDEARAVEMITRGFGPNVWKHAVIVFTCSDLVRPASRYPEALKVRGDLLREEIGKHADATLANDIPAVAVDNFCTVTPDGRMWKGNLYATVFRRVAADGLPTFAIGTEFKVRVIDAAPAAGGRVRRTSSTFSVLDSQRGDDEDHEAYEVARGEKAVQEAPIVIDRQTAAGLQQHTRETIVDTCVRKGGSIGESVGRFFGSASTGRSVGESLGRAVGSVLKWFGW